MRPNDLRKAREAAGFTLEQAAEAVGLSVSQVSRIERGIREPRQADMDRFAQVYGKPPRARVHAREEESLVFPPVNGWVAAGVWLDLELVDDVADERPRGARARKAPWPDNFFAPRQISSCQCLCHMAMSPYRTRR